MAHTERCLFKSSAQVFVQVSDQTTDKNGNFSTTAIDQLFREGVKYTVRVDLYGYCRCTNDPLKRCEEVITSFVFPDFDNGCAYQHKVFEQQTLALGSCPDNCNGVLPFTTFNIDGTCPIEGDGRKPSDFPDSCQSGYFGSTFNNAAELKCYFRHKGWTGSNFTAARAAMLFEAVRECIKKEVAEAVCAMFPDTPHECGWYVTDLLNKVADIKTAYKLNRAKHPDRIFSDAQSNLAQGGSGGSSSADEASRDKCVYNLLINTTAKINITGGPCTILAPSDVRDDERFWNGGGGDPCAGMRVNDMNNTNGVSDIWNVPCGLTGMDHEWTNWLHQGDPQRPATTDTDNWDGREDCYGVTFSMLREFEWKEDKPCIDIGTADPSHEHPPPPEPECECIDFCCKSAKQIMEFDCKGFRVLPGDTNEWARDGKDFHIPYPFVLNDLGNPATYDDWRDRVKCYTNWPRNTRNVKRGKLHQVRKIVIDHCKPDKKKLEDMKELIEDWAPQIHYMQFEDFSVTFKAQRDRVKCCPVGIVGPTGINKLLECKRGLMGGHINGNVALNLIAPGNTEDGTGPIDTRYPQGSNDGTQLLSTEEDSWYEFLDKAVQQEVVGPAGSTNASIGRLGMAAEKSARRECQQPQEMRRAMLDLMRSAAGKGWLKICDLCVIPADKMFIGGPGGGGWHTINEWLPAYKHYLDTGSIEPGSTPLPYPELDFRLASNQDCPMTGMHLVQLFNHMFVHLTRSSCPQGVDVDP